MIISLFIGCYNDLLFPETGKAVVKVLERLGHTVDFPASQTCCGQMHHNSGYANDTAGFVRNFVETFQSAEVICIPSASCTAMIHENYSALAARSGDSSLQHAVEQILPRVFEFTQLLTTKLGITDLGAFFPYKVTLHTSCHSLRSLQVGNRPAELLHSVGGLQLSDLDQSDQCCGFGGIFAIKNPDTSAAILSEKIRCILDTEAGICTGLDNSCLMHIGGALRRQRTGVRTLHIAEILAVQQTDNDQ